MKKSYYMGIITILIALNLLVFSCQNSSTTSNNTTTTEEATSEAESSTASETKNEAEAAATEEKTEDAATENTIAENAETEKEVADTPDETKEKPATMNTSAAPPKPQKTSPKKPKKPATPMAKFKFDKKEHNFGTIKVGTKVEHDFHFTNNGKVPLVITGANSTCGCTIPEFSKEPIPPNGRGKVKVTFDSTGKIGMQDKHVTITANTYPKNTVIHMKGLALTENMMPKKKTTVASPSPYSSPKLSQPAATPPSQENTTPPPTKTSTDGGSSLVPTANKPAENAPSNENAEQNAVDNKEDQQH